MDHQSSQRINIGSDSQNEEHENHFTEPISIDSGFNDYSDGLLQPADMIEPNNVNSHINCPQTSDGILRMSYDNMILSQSEQQPMPQTHQVPWVQCSPPHSIHNNHILQDVGNINNDNSIPTMQCSPLRSVPMQQLQHEQTLQHPVIQQYTRNSTNCINNQHQNLKYDHDELFKIVISGIEIVFRRKPTDLNQIQGERNKQPQQQNGKCCSTLKNQTKRNQNRMHPYSMPIDQNKLINTRDNDHCSCRHNMSVGKQ